MCVRLFAARFELPTAPPEPTPDPQREAELTRRCLACGVEFRAQRVSKRYCSGKCYRQNFYAKKRAAALAAK